MFKNVVNKYIKREKRRSKTIFSYVEKNVWEDLKEHEDTKIYLNEKTTELPVNCFLAFRIRNPFFNLL